MNERQFGHILANAKPWQPRPLLGPESHAAFLRQMTRSARRTRQALCAWQLIAPPDTSACEVEVDAEGRVIVMNRDAASIERLQRQVISLQTRLREHLNWLRRLEFSVAPVSNR